MDGNAFKEHGTAIRLFEYDAQIALDEGRVTEETLTVAFPITAVLYLRTYKKTPDRMKYVIITPGGTVRYGVPVMKVQTYSLDDIFEKGLLMLIGKDIAEQAMLFLTADFVCHIIRHGTSVPLFHSFYKIVSKNGTKRGVCCTGLL